MERLRKQIDFILELDKMKKVIRQTYLADGSRKENDAEHTWHLAMMCLILSEYANEKMDPCKAMELVLVHDLVEIYAGDTYAYDEEGNKGKEEREAEAAKKIFGMLPEDQGRWMKDLFDEFEEGITMESKFANTLDKIQPILLNDASDGRSWREHQVYVEQVLNRNKKTKDGSEKLWEYAKEIIDSNVMKGNLIKG
ncbi:MAG TPA: HD domain-containing protein [Candidatus Merdenecus merdavium]|nr:HD domain-containing protein [Candidatus Merdenecus merdavium]